MLHLHYKHQLVNVRKTITVYYENHLKHLNALCGKNSELGGPRFESEPRDWLS
jgi:hypothetical protein